MRAVRHRRRAARHRTTARCDGVSPAAGWHRDRFSSGKRRGDEARVRWQGLLGPPAASRSDGARPGCLRIAETSPDRDTVWITVMIPDAHCPANARSVAVNSFAVLTTKRTSIAGPSGVSGQVDVYKVISPLSGNAW